jgi:DNA-3-methyladenine glycosylase II
MNQACATNRRSFPLAIKSGVHTIQNLMTAEALKHLAGKDATMRRLVAQHGPCGLSPQARRSPFESLARAIAHQQLNGIAAGTILQRFIKLFPGRRFPRPEDLAGVEDDDVRAAGFSRAKVAALRDLAAKALDGTVPSSRVIRKLNDAEIIARLTEVRGVGQWTVEMLLIFQLGRPDVLPVDDFGIRNGFRHAYRKAGMPTPKELLAFGERWRPHRTTAAWYLWQVANAAQEKK